MTPYERVLRNIGVFNKIIANLSDDPLDGNNKFDSIVRNIADKEVCSTSMAHLISSLFPWIYAKEGVNFWNALYGKFYKMSDKDFKGLLSKNIKYNKDLK